MSHTPGPWRRSSVAGSFQVPFHILSENGKPVAYCEGQQLRPDRTSIGEARSNARLIAAAPDLLAACKALAHDIRAMQFTDGEYRLSEDSARSILALLDREISKAEGKE